MKILAIDIGAGTQDILLFDSEKKVENCISLILPTPSKIHANKIREIEGNLYIYGDTIGGGSLIRAILQHLKKGYRVRMDESAAYSIRNDLHEVRSMGIEIGGRPKAGHFHELEIHEIDLPLLRRFLREFGEDFNFDAVAVAVQDHGVAPQGVSDRTFRFDQMEAMLRRDSRPESFHFTEASVPEYFIRMKSAIRAVKRDSSSPIVVMDTSFSAILGCLDEVKGPSLVVNVGNGHTISALVIEGRIEALYEHHTHELTPATLEQDLRRLVRGELSRQEVFEKNGHGAITLRNYDGEFSILVTGPNRDLFKGTSLNFTYATPAGNTMMTGPMGLVRATLYRFSKRGEGGSEEPIEGSRG